MIEKYLIIFLSVIVLFLVIELIREEKLTFKYAFGWMFVSVAAIILTVFDSLFLKIGNIFGFPITSDFVLFIFLSIFVFMSLMMTVFLCQQNNHNDKIAQQLGILEFEIEQIRKKSGEKNEKSKRDG